MQVIEIRMFPSGTPIPSWNQITTPGTSGLKISDLLDDAGASTGYTFSQTGSFIGNASTSFATSSPDANWPVDVFRAVFYKGVADQGTVGFTIGGLTSGDSYSIECAGNGFISDARDTSFFITGGTPSPGVYDNSSVVDPVAQPVTISGTVPASGNLDITMTTAENFLIVNGFRLTVSAAGSLSISAADDITSDGQTATFTLSGNTNPPVSATLNGTDVGTLTLVSGSTYSYTAPLIADDTTADLVVSVDSTTVSAVISYANSYPYELVTHGTPDSNSIFFDTAFATNGPVEWGVVTDYDSAVVVVDHAALDAAEDELNDVALHSTEVAAGNTTATYKYFVQESGATGTFQATITIADTVSLVMRGRPGFHIKMSIGF